MRLNATHKGLITGCAMISLYLFLYFLGYLDSLWKNTAILVYIAGILWTLIPFVTASNNDWKFKNFFSEGFKCFIIITLLMVIFWWIFYKLHPEIVERWIQEGKKLMQQQGNSTPAEINEKIDTVRKSALTQLTSANIVIYLILGAVITTISSLVLIQTRKK